MNIYRLIKCIARWLVHIFLCSKLYWKFGTLLSEQARSMVSMVNLPAGRWIAERKGEAQSGSDPVRIVLL